MAPAASLSVPAPSPGGAEPSAYEQQHVHAVYDAIAPHFSDTRTHKVWPAVAAFLHRQPAGSVGVDVGCGNGKYLGVNPDVYLVGCDRSRELVRLAREGRLMGTKTAARASAAAAAAAAAASTVTAAAATAAAAAFAATATATAGAKNEGEKHIQSPFRGGGDEAFVADGFALPFPDGRADFAICIAVVHHMSTRERRREAIARVLASVRGGGAGTALLYVWALEQRGSRRGWEAGDAQDLLVPWVVTDVQRRKQRGDDAGGSGGTDESREKKKNGGASGDDKERSRDRGQGEAAVPSTIGKGTSGEGTRETFLRYYHLYAKGELEEDVEAVGGRVLDGGYERDNWWVVCARA